jgi:signal transduction histidine kinase
VDAQRLVRTLRESLEPLAAHSGLEILWDGKDLPSCFRGNGKGITLILQNVITNAVYHAYPCGASGPIRVYGGTLRKGGLYFRVEDEGQGIPSKEAKRVFEPFYRGQASLKNHEKGSGLGLYLVKKTAMVIDASVRLESPYHTEDGFLMNGCRFTLELPHASEVKHES